MKVLTQEEVDENYRVVLKGGVKGFTASSAVAIPGSYILNRTWPYYRSLPLSLKVLGIIVATVPASVIQAEHESLAWERARWTDAGKLEMDALARIEEERIASLATSERIKDWVARRRYSIVGASWALSMALSFGIVMRNPYQTFPQKVVQARMWAQGLTVGVLVASAGFAASDPTPKHARVDHSWQNVLTAQKKEAAEREGRNRTASLASESKNSS